MSVQDISFLEQVNILSEQMIQLCYHCHKCTSGCPVAGEMTYGPDRVLRMVQFGEREKLLTSTDIWLCASCETCGTRCPNEIDTARVMDALRSISLASGVKSAEPDAEKFHRLFLYVVQNLGRSHEVVLLMIYKLWTMNLVSDMDSGIKMFVKRKIPLIPRPIKGSNQVKSVFQTAKEHDLPGVEAE